MKAGKLTLRRGVGMPEKPDIVYNLFQNKKDFSKSATQGNPTVNEQVWDGRSQAPEDIRETL